MLECESGLHGGVAQMARAHGSYPWCHRFDSCRRYQKTRPLGQAVKTPPFHGGNRGSIPLGVTKKGETLVSPFLVARIQRIEPER